LTTILLVFSNLLKTIAWQRQLQFSTCEGIKALGVVAKKLLGSQQGIFKNCVQVPATKLNIKAIKFLLASGN
jgi:uncharacterized protein (DUF486 family)